MTRRTMTSAAVMACAAMLCVADVSQADVQYFAYDLTRTSWTDNNWSATSGGSYTNAWGGYNDAVLEGAGGTVSGGSAVSMMTFNADGYILTGGFTMGSPSAPNFIVNSNYTAQITGDLGYANGANILWKTGTGTLELSGVNSTPQVRAQQGTLKIAGGSLTNSGDFYIGGSTYQAEDPTVGTFVISDGSVTTGGASKIFLMGENRDGANKVAQFTQTGGTFTLASGTFISIANGGGVSQLDISGGTFNASDTFYLGSRANATLNISGTASVNLALLRMGWGATLDLNPTQNTVNLGNGSAGGTLQATKIEPGAAGSWVFNFNGGTLRAAADQANFMSGLTSANVQSGGATIDTNGFNIGIGQALLADSASGGLTKIGNGILTLTGDNTYTGDTDIQAGTLSINSAYLADAVDVLLTSGATFDLDYAGTDTINALYFDGALQNAGTWGSLSSAATYKSSFFTGTGMLNVVVGVPTPVALPGGLALLAMAAIRRRRV